jgi:hypothetical protein
LEDQVQNRKCAGSDATPRRSNRVLVVLATTLALLFVCRLSLIATSNGLDGTQRDSVTRAIILLERQGFSSEVSILRHLTNFRSTDNWWNRYLGHPQAYAATNFPFEVVTLYPRFFEVAVDDHERAVILLHESHHLLGRSEDGALERVWRAKSRLGWSADAYGHTRCGRTRWSGRSRACPTCSSAALTAGPTASSSTKERRQGVPVDRDRPLGSSRSLPTCAGAFCSRCAWRRRVSTKPPPARCRCRPGPAD